MAAAGAATPPPRRTGAAQQQHQHPPQPQPQPRRLSPRKLVDACLWAWDTRRPAALSLDAHVAACLTEPALRGAHADDRGFLEQVVYGLHRYAPLLTAYLNGFYHANRSARARPAARPDPTQNARPRAAGPGSLQSVRPATARGGRPPWTAPAQARPHRTPPLPLRRPTHLAPPTTTIAAAARGSGRALRTDATRYRLFAYLAAFRMQELGVSGFRRARATLGRPKGGRAGVGPPSAPASVHSADAGPAQPARLAARLSLRLPTARARTHVRCPQQGWDARSRRPFCSALPSHPRPPPGAWSRRRTPRKWRCCCPTSSTPPRCGRARGRTG